MTKTLRLTFKNGSNKKTGLTINKLAENLTTETIRQSMDTIAKAEVFANEGIEVYQKPLSAEYIERTVTSVFDDSATGNNK